MASQATPEQVEKARQAVMRFRELLDLMNVRLDSYERAYANLFAHLPAEMASLSEKERQRQAAHTVIDDDKALVRAVLTARFDSRDFEREFEALHDRIVELYGLDSLTDT